MIKFRMWSEADDEMRTIVSKEHSETPVITLSTTDPFFDGQYIALEAHQRTVEEMGRVPATLRRRNRRNFYVAAFLGAFFILLAYNIGLREGQNSVKPGPRTEVVVPQTHTVKDVQPFQVPDVYCPEEDSCEYRWEDSDGDGWGEAQLVEVTP